MANQASPKARLVLSHGRIFTGLRTGFVDALAVWADRVLAVGSNADIEALVGPDTVCVKLNGRAATAGINDGHQHLLPFGLSLTEINLNPTEVNTLAELLARVTAFAKRTSPGEWIVGGRYDHAKLDVGRHPLRDELDRAAPDHPVFIKRTCGHMGVANSRALTLAGVDEHTAQPDGGHIERANGRLTGLLQERAQELIGQALPPLSQARLVDGIARGGQAFLQHGITSVMDAGVGLRQGYDDLKAYLAARRENKLPVRAYLSLTASNGVAQRAFDNGLLTGSGDEYLKIGSVKLFTDGSAGGKTAAMSEPYRCGCDQLGILVYDDSTLREQVEHYNALGFQISLHAIGDAAIQQALDAVSQADRQRPVAGRRHRIEHCGFTHDAQIDTMRRLGMQPAPQPIFLYEFGDQYLTILGEPRTHNAYPMRRWTDAGLRPIASSDTPVSSYNPMTNLYTMLTRKSERGAVLGDGQRLNAAQAIDAMTANGAYGSFSETVKGTLTPGMLADIAVWDSDIFSAEPDALLHACCDITVLNGEIVFDRHGQLA